MRRPLGVALDCRSRLVDCLQRASSSHAATRARHAFKQVARVLATYGVLHHLAAVLEALRVCHIDLAIGVATVNGVDHGRGHASRHGKAATVGGRNVEVALVVVGQREVVDLLGLHHARHLLEGEHEVHLAPDGLAHGLELLGGAGPHEDDLGVGVLGANHARRERHGREGHGDAVGVLGELLLGHDRPRRAARRAHEGELVGDLIHEVLGLLDGAEVRSKRDLLDAGEA